ncbi:MAG: Ig-like domain-containing protein, partial [Endomicrobiia bacterium]
ISPQNVQLNLLSSNAIELKWTHPVGGVAGYKIDRSTDEVYWIQLTSSCIDTSYIDTDLVLDTTYFYRLASYNMNYLLSPFVNISNYAQDNFPPGKITTLSATKGAQIGQVKLVWTYPGDDGYVGNVIDGTVEIKYSSNTNTTASSAEYTINFSTSFNPSDSATLLITGLLPKTTYMFWIRTRDDMNLWSEYSDGVTVITKYIASLFSHTPLNNEIGVLDNSYIKLFYDDEIDTMTIVNACKFVAIKNNLCHDIYEEVLFSIVSYDKREINIIPHTILNKNYKYKITISSNVKDVYDNIIDENIEFVFTTIMDCTKDNKFILEEDIKTVVEIPANTIPEDASLFIVKTPQKSPKEVDVQKIISANTKIQKFDEKTLLSETVREFVLYDKNKNVLKTIFAGVGAKITIPYKDVDQDGFIDDLNKKIKETTLKMYYLDEENNLWVRIPDALIDTEKNTVSAYVKHFSVYTLVGEEDYSLSDAYAYPVPYRPNADPTHKKIVFTNLSREAVIKVYTINGELIKTIKEPQDDGMEDFKTSWENVDVGSDVYIYVIENKKNKKSGKLIIIK